MRHMFLSRNKSRPSVCLSIHADISMLFLLCFYTPFLLHLPSALLGEEFVSDEFRVVVDSRVDTHALDTANHLGNLALVHRSELRDARVANLTSSVGEFLDKRKVL